MQYAAQYPFTPGTEGERRAKGRYLFMGKKPKNKPAGSPRGFDFYLNKISMVVFTVLAVVFVYTAIST